MKDPVFDIETNIVPQINFLESLRSQNPEARVVYIGTRAQYGRVENPPITETTPLNPMDIYSVSKQAVEWYHMLYSKCYTARYAGCGPHPCVWETLMAPAIRCGMPSMASRII
jgi:GDP-D-mannose dehydratase